MSTVATTVEIDLDSRSYPVRIGPGALSDVGRLMAARGLRGSALLVTNPVLEQLYVPTVCDSLAAAKVRVTTHVVAPGERAKRLSMVERVCDAAIAAGLDRGSAIIALGGGVIGDLAGFAAACLYRGVPFVQLPTTLLAMVDSSVGGKTGVNSGLGKNLIGAFWQPSLVVADLATLQSLPARELRCGLAEVIKHGAILDESLFARLERRFVQGQGEPGHLRLTPTASLDAATALDCVQRSCELKGAVVAADERESGQRAWLNFGHTFGHALEAVSGYGKLHHGEAVAIGMVLAAETGVRRGDIDETVRERLAALLAAVGLPTTVPAGLDLDEVWAVMQRDKKAREGRLRLTLLRELGEAMVAGDTPAELIRGVLQDAAAVTVN